MRFAPPEEEVELYKTGFDNDILNREKIGKTLSEIVDRIEDPLVIALDGAWGTGKSYFLKRWVGAHKTQNDGKATTVYFDAFANDYLSDPLISLLAEISHRTEPSKFEKVKKAAIAVAKPLARAALATISYGATEIANAAGHAAIKAIESESGKTIDRLWEVASGRHEGMKKFRQAIEGLTKPGGDDETPIPLVIVIDELDRCRPDYALELLKVIKHFFVVSHVHFVLGVNLSSLENSVKMRYGSDIDANSYLKKFFSFSMLLPEHIGDGKKTKSIVKLAHQAAQSIGFPERVRLELFSQLDLLSNNNHISMRDVSRIVSSATLLPRAASQEGILQGWTVATVTLLITRIINPRILQKLIRGTITDAELTEYLGITRENSYLKLPAGSYNQAFEPRRVSLYSVWASICDVDVQDPNISLHPLDGALHLFNDKSEITAVARTIYSDWLHAYEIK